MSWGVPGKHRRMTGFYIVIVRASRIWNLVSCCEKSLFILIIASPRGKFLASYLRTQSISVYSLNSEDLMKVLRHATV